MNPSVSLGRMEPTRVFVLTADFVEPPFGYVYLLWHAPCMSTENQETEQPSTLASHHHPRVELSLMLYIIIFITR